MATYKFGCAQVTGKADWLVQNASKNNTAEEVLALNEQGEPVVAHYFRKITEMTFEVVIPESESSFPAVGDVMTYEGVKWYVASVSLSQTNSDFCRYTLSCKRFTSAGLPA